MLLQDLDVDQEAPIDVFHIVDTLGLWLVFNPLKNLLGAAVPAGDGGIMVTTERGPAVQRFTVAHEIGHWVLDYGEAAFDTEQDIYRPDADREILAQIFASQLLMPPPLMYRACARYGVENSQSAAPNAVYLVARDIGASYEAAARQLANLKIISGRRRDELLKIQPAVIKSELCLGHRPAGAVDVWPVGLDSIGSTVTITEGDEIVVLLPENRTTGHRWLTADDLARRSRRPHGEPPEIDVSASAAPRRADNWKPGPISPEKSINTALDRIPGNRGSVRILPQQEPQAPVPLEVGRPLAVVDDRYQPSRGRIAASEVRAVRRAIARRKSATADASDTQVAVGGTGTRILALRSLDAGRQVFEIAYSSAYNPEAPAVETYSLDVEVKPTPAVLRRREYLSIDLDDVGDQPVQNLDDADGENRGRPLE